MAQRPQTKRVTSRPPRYFVPNNEPASIAISGRRIPGTVRVLSMTGGLIELPTQLPTGTMAELRMSTLAGPFAGVIEFLRNVKGKAQAFRFVHLDTEAQLRLARGLEKMHAQGLGDVKPSKVDKLLAMARRALGKKS